jgi:hypothetical protein
MAVLTVLFATVLLMGIGLSVALIGTSEATLAADDRAARTLREASLAGVHLAVADLRLRPSWSAVLSPGTAPFSANPGRAFVPDLTPLAPWDGSRLDLVAMTADVQAAADTGVGDPQAWRLFECGWLDALVPGAGAGPWYVAVWVADDTADGDGNPSTDANGVVLLRGVAYGPRGARVATVVSVMKTVVAGEPDRVRILTVRPVS